MLLNSYKENGLMWLTNVNGATSNNLYAFRGDLVVVEGAMNESAGKRNPPISVVESSIILADENKMKMVIGFVEELETLPTFVEKYKDDLASDCIAFFYVENIDKPMQVELEGINFPLVPFSSGMVWNEVLEELYIEKGDLKGQSAEDKIVTVYDALKDHKAKGDKVSIEDALKQTIEVKKELGSGPV